MYLTVSIVENIVLSHQKKKKQICEVTGMLVNLNPFSVYICQIITFYTLNILQFYLSITPQYSWEKKERIQGQRGSLKKT